MTAGARIDGNQAVDAAVHTLARPPRFGHIVVHHAAGGMHAITYPAGVAEGGDEEADALLQRDVDPLPHALQVRPVACLDERIEPDGMRGQRADVPQTRAVLIAVNVGQGERLDHAQAARLTDRSDELRVRARVHRPADQRHPYLCVARKGGFHQRTGPSRQRTVARATTVPSRLMQSAVTSNSVSVVTAGTATVLTARMMPRAFFR